MNFGAADTTYREILHTTLGGPLVRVTLSNRYGTQPLTIGAVHLALTEIHPSTPSEISLASANSLTFNGKPSITIPAGADATSDPAALTLPAGASVAVSLFIPAQPMGTVSFHGAAYTTSFSAPGNVVGQKTLASPATFTSWAFLDSVDVQAIPPTAAAIVCLGDSITDGTGSDVDALNNWPDLLAKRLHADKKTADLAVLNEGIGGNMVLHNSPDPRFPASPNNPLGPPDPNNPAAPRGYGNGPSALARFDGDVLALPGVRYLVFLEAINDIGMTENPKTPTHTESADDLIQGYVQLIERAHNHGIKVIGATLTPYAGAGYSSPAGEQIRQALNTWIRTTKLLDGVIDFEAATSDGATPPAYKAGLGRPDHLHPTPAGYKAMADSIDLKLFRLDKQEKYDITHQQ